LTDTTCYKLLVEKRALDGWQALEVQHPDEMAELKLFLKQHPTNLRATSGKAKKLRGKLKKYYQYDVTYGDRVRYQVNKAEKTVAVIYAGSHP